MKQIYVNTKIGSCLSCTSCRDSCSISYLSDEGFYRKVGWKGILKTKKLYVSNTIYVTAEDSGSSFPANHGKLFPRAFYARHGTELTNQSSQHQHSTQRGFPGTKM